MTDLVPRAYRPGAEQNAILVRLGRIGPASKMEMSMIRIIGCVSVDTRGDLQPIDVDGNGRYYQ